MSIARALVEKHGKIAAVLLPASILGGFAYSAATGTSPLEDSKKWMQGKDAQQGYTLNFRLGGVGTK